MPKYGFKPVDATAPASHANAAAIWPAPNAATSVAGLLGPLLVLAVALALGAGLRALRRRTARP